MPDTSDLKNIPSVTDLGHARALAFYFESMDIDENEKRVVLELFVTAVLPGLTLTRRDR